MVGARVIADPGIKGAEVRGVPDIIDPEQRWQREIAKPVATIREMGEPGGNGEAGAASSCPKGIDQPRSAQLPVGCLPANAVEIGQEYGRVAAGGHCGDPGDLLVSERGLADAVPTEARRRWMGDDDGKVAARRGVIACRSGRPWMELQQLGLMHGEAGDESLAGDTGGCST
jgi:hypothetical protein